MMSIMVVVVSVSSCWVDRCPGLALTVLVEVKGVVSMVSVSGLLAESIDGS